MLFFNVVVSPVAEISRHPATSIGAAMNVHRCLGSYRSQPSIGTPSEVFGAALVQR